MKTKSDRNRQTAFGWLGALLLLALGAGVASATSGTWNGGTDPNWNNTANWSSAAVPGVADTATFDSTSTANLTITNPVAVWSLSGITVVNPPGAVTLSKTDGNSIYLGNVDMSAATQDLTITNSHTGAAHKLTQPANFNVAANRTLTVSGVEIQTGGANLTNTISGAGTNKMIANNYDLGRGVAGNTFTVALNIAAGSTLMGKDRAGTDRMNIRNWYGTTTVNQSGGVVDVANVGFFPLTGINNSAATYNLNGGILKTKRIFTAAPGTGSSATFVFNGGTVQAQANATAGFIDGGMTTVRIDAGGGTIDNGGLSLTVSKAMTGAGGLTCTGAGTLIFSAANTYSGGTTINSGSTLQLLGAGIVAGNVTNNGTLKPDHTGGYFNQNIYGTGQIVKTSSSDVQFLTGTTADTQTWSLAGLGRIFFQGQNQLGRGNIAITGTGRLIHITGGNVTLENAITMSSGGWLGNRASAAGVLTVTNLTLPASGTAVFNNDDTATTNLVASGPALTLTGGLTIQTGGGSTTVGDVTLNHAISGGFGVTKTSIGALTLTSANTYDGSTIVSNGTLLVNGSLAAGAVTVISGATLGGSGSIGGSVTFDTGAKALFTNGSTLAIAGALTANGNVVHLNIPSDLATNTYLLATYSGGSGSFASAPVIANGGSFAAGTTNYITTGGGQVNLVVANASVTPPQTNITYSVSSGELVLDWPAGEGWQLQSQTNNLNVGLGTNWTTITGATPPFTNSINATNPTVFYRLTYP